MCGPRRSRTSCLVIPNVRGALAFAAESQVVVTSATVAIGVPELGVETSAEIDGQLFVVLSALTERASFDIVMSAGGDHGFESWRTLHGRWNPYTAGRARSLLREILSLTQMKLPELMGAIEKMEDLLRRYSSRRDAQGNAHNLAEDIRMSSVEALLPDDLEKHVQLNRARLTSYCVLREEIKTYCECRGHAARNVRQKGPSHPGGDDPMDIGAFGKGKGNQSKGKHGKGKGEGRQGQQGQHGQDKGAKIFLTPDGMKRGTRIARMMEHERWDRVFSATCVGVPWQLRPDQRNLVRPVVPETEAEQGVALVIVMPAFPKVDRRRYVTKNNLVKYGYTDECQSCTQLASGMHNAEVPHDDRCRARIGELMAEDDD